MSYFTLKIDKHGVDTRVYKWTGMWLLCLTFKGFGKNKGMFRLKQWNDGCKANFKLLGIDKVNCSCKNMSIGHGYLNHHQIFSYKSKKRKKKKENTLNVSYVEPRITYHVVFYSLLLLICSIILLSMIIYKWGIIKHLDQPLETGVEVASITFATLYACMEEKSRS